MDRGYQEYIDGVLSGRIVTNQWIRLACQRFVDDLASGDYYFNEKKYNTVLAFTGVLKHYASGAAGKPFILEPWQKFLVANIFCLYDSTTNRRKYKQAYVSISRKNGKTTLAAALGLFGLVADGEPSSSIVMAANSREQARIDFDCAAAFARQLDPHGKFLKVLRNEIICQKTNSKLKVIAADSTKLDGSNDSMCICDELHEAPDSKLFDVLRSGQGFREQPLMFSITTAGFRIGGFCHSYEGYCKEVLQGVKTDDSLFAMIYSPDEGDDWTDERTWIKSNPNLGVTVKTEWLREQVNQAKQSPALEVGVRTKNINCWVSSSSVWIPEHILKQCLRSVDLSDYIGKRNWICYFGYDLASVSDLTALSILLIDPDSEEYVFKNYYYLPKTALEGKPLSELYKMWNARGYLIITDSPTTDYSYIKNQILYWYEKFDVQEVAYDSWNASQISNELIAEGLPLKAFSQSIGSFNRACKEMERLVLSGKIVIDDNPINRFCFDNVELRFDHAGNCKPEGDHITKKIDGVIAMQEALGAYLNTLYGSNEAFVIPQ